MKIKYLTLVIFLITLLLSVSVQPADLGWTKVTRIIDGDTIVVERHGTVRLIGIDTPETKHPQKPVEYMGREATAATQRLALGKRVKLETDVQARDRYGRLLAYVWFSDGSMLNAELVRRGYARVSTYPPNVKYQSRFLKMEREARANNRGLWSPQKASPAKPQAKSTSGRSAKSGLRIVSITSPVSAGSYATLVAQTVPYANCTITVYYKSGPSEAKGLYPQKADANGRVSWTWKVGTRTTPGTWPIEVTARWSGGSQTARTSFRVL